MLTLHHLNNSRSQRILWLLEELKVEYDIIYYKRDKSTNLAPDELKKIHPLGKSPIITYKDKTLIESAAITTFIVEKYADDSFSPKNEDWNKSGVKTAGYWPKHLLWNKDTLTKSIDDISKKHNLNIKMK